MLLRDPIPGQVAGTRIVEGVTRKPGVLGCVEGVFSVSDVENKNGRVYERSLWEGVLNEKKYQQALKDKTLLGEPDHPETRTQSAIRESSHTITEMHLDDDGKLRGMIEVFDNPLGRTFWPMLQAGVRLGLSTRGDGDLVENSRTGKTTVDPASYEFHGTDFVLNPSFVEALPESITEDVRKAVRLALTEAVEADKLRDGVKEDVEALLESAEKAPETKSAGESKAPEPTPQPVEGEGEKSRRETEGVNTKALEAALTQLGAEKLKTAELDARVKELASGLEKAEGLVGTKEGTFRSSVKKMREVIKRLEQEKAELGRRLEGSKSDDTVTELKLVMAENQRAHETFVEAHKTILEERDDLKARLEEGRRVIEGLRDRVKEAIEEKQRAAEALREQEEKTQGRLSDERLQSYKKARRVEEAELSEVFEALLERAQTEAEVEAVMEAHQGSQAQRFPELPFDLNSRKKREAVLEAVDDQLEAWKSGDEKKADEEKAEEQDDQKKVVRHQLRR